LLKVIVACNLPMPATFQVEGKEMGQLARPELTKSEKR